MQVKSKRLMVSLCSLALSSLFVLNNKTVAHADSINDSAAAITFDDDTDTVQSTEKNDVSVQSINTKMNSANDAVQQKSVQNNNALSTGDTQSVDNRVLKDLDSNETTVSNNYYNAESREDINNTANNTHNNAVKVANVNGSFKSIPVHISDPSSNRIYVNFVNTNGQSVGQGNYWIDLSTSQSVQAGVQNQTEKGVAHVSSADNQCAQIKVANVNATIQNTPVQIVNPQNNQVVVHYVNMNGQAVAGVQDTTIDVTKLGRGQYTVPSGYQLANNGGYTADDNTSTSQVQGYYESDSNKLIKVGNPLTGSVAYKLAHNFRATDSGDAAVDFDNGDGTYTHASSEIYLNIYPYGNEYRPDCDWIVDVQSMANDYYLYSHRVNNDDGKKPITAKDVYYIPHDSTNTYERVLTPQEGAELLNWANSVFGSSMVSSVDGMTYVGDPTSDRNSPHFVLKMRGHELAYRFTDNSGQVKAVNGNTIDLAVTKPQNVDPATNSRLNAEATRTIKINFPGQVPPSYKNIVNDHGVLTQTVKFTRTGQEDMLTGNLIESSIGPWQSNNSDPNFLGFPERTLPRIPGYTLSIKPA